MGREFERERIGRLKIERKDKRIMGREILYFTTSF